MQCHSSGAGHGVRARNDRPKAAWRPEHPLRAPCSSEMLTIDRWVSMLKQTLFCSIPILVKNAAEVEEGLWVTWSSFIVFEPSDPARACQGDQR